MDSLNSALAIPDDDLYLDLGEEIAEPALRRLIECVREIDPAVVRASQRCGAGTTMAVLLAIAVNLAIDHGDPTLFADALRLNAEVLDGEAPFTSIAGTA